MLAIVAAIKWWSGPIDPKQAKLASMCFTSMKSVTYPMICSIEVGRNTCSTIIVQRRSSWNSIWSRGDLCFRMVHDHALCVDIHFKCTSFDLLQFYCVLSLPTRTLHVSYNFSRYTQAAVPHRCISLDSSLKINENIKIEYNYLRELIENFLYCNN